MPGTVTNICPNCQHKNHPGWQFCEKCGQKNRPIRITFYEFIKDFIDVIFNLDNRFWKTVKTLFLPGRLTKNFFEGKRKSYYHPLRLYVVGVIILFTVLSFLKIDNVIKINGSANFGERYERRQLIDNQGQILNKTIDSLQEIYSDRAGVELLDSVAQKLYLKNESDTFYIRNEEVHDSSDFTLLFESFRISIEDQFITDIDTVMEAQNVGSFFDRLALRQFLKGSRDLGSFNAFLFANLTWLFLAIIPVFSLVLKLFYIRRNRFYMEHFVFLLHLFSALVFMLAIMMAILIPLDSRTVLGILGGILVTVYPFLAFKAYYKQGFFKTFIKYLAIGFLFLIAFILTFLVFVLITATFF